MYPRGLLCLATVAIVLMCQSGNAADEANTHTFRVRPFAQTDPGTKDAEDRVDHNKGFSRTQGRPDHQGEHLAEAILPPCLE